MHCRMLQREHSAIISTFINRPVAIKTFVLTKFKWPLKTGFTISQELLTLIEWHNPGDDLDNISRNIIFPTMLHFDKFRLR